MKNNNFFLIALAVIAISFPAFATLTLTNIGLGTTANDGTGTNLRAAGTIINTNNSAIVSAVNQNTTDIATLNTGKASTTVTADLQSQINSLAAGGAYPTTTWSSLLAISSPTTWVTRQVTDLGSSVFFTYNGTRWVPVGGSFVLAKSNTASSVTGTTAETALATITIPANLIGANDSIQIRTLWSMTSSANNKTMRVRLGGIAGAIFRSPLFTTITTLQDDLVIRANNATNSQKSFAQAAGNAYGTSGGTLTTGNRDMTTSQDIVITGQAASSSDTITLEGYEVIILR